MNEWMDIGIHQVNALLRNNPDFLDLTVQFESARKDYLSVVGKLSPENQQTIEDYLALCEEVEYQRTITAYYCGKRNG